MVEDSDNSFMKYLRKDRLPSIFCSGCGNGIVLNTFFKAIELENMNLDNFSLVSGIGCSSRIPGYVKCDSLHTTHGRSIAYATGLKLSNPDMNVVVFTGDGDSASIGGNHLIHAARRNIDLTVVCINNNIYGMTGGQISPTSPKNSYGSTAPFGSLETPFNLSELVSVAGASYVSRWTTAHPIQISKAIKDGIDNKGFSFIEAVSQCPTYFGRKNKLRTAVDMLNWFKENSILSSQAKKMKKEDLINKIIVGEIKNETNNEFTDGVFSLMEKNSGKKSEFIRSAYKG